MTIQIARRLGRALGVRSATRLKEVDESLREYVRSVSPGATIPVLGAVDWAQLVNVPSAFPPAAHLAGAAWVPADSSGAGLVLTVNSASYVRHEDLVIARTRLTYPVTASGATAELDGLPFAVAAPDANRMGFISYATIAAARYVVPNPAATSMRFYDSAGAALTNAQLSGGTLFFTVMYLR